MSAAELLLCLSEDLLKLFETTNAYDISIRVGQEPNAKTFKAHSSLLIARSPYFAAALSNDWVKSDNGVIQYAKPNISPRVFEIILKYLYSGAISLEGHGIPELIEILVAADELSLERLIDYTQAVLIENHEESLRQNFATLYQTVFEHESFTELQKFCTELASTNPEAIFQSEDFAQLNEAAVVSLLERDDLNMQEVEVWDSIVQWASAQAGLSSSDSTSWSTEDFAKFEKIITKLIPYIRFFHVSSQDFYNKVKPYAKVLPENLYEDLLHHYLVPGSHRKDVEARPARSNLMRSAILNSKQLLQISKWIDGDNATSSSRKPNHRFHLLLRGSRDGFTAQDFHALCDNQGATLTVIRVKGTGQLIGGYNPLSWHSKCQDQVDNRTFIFSLGTAEAPKLVHGKYLQGRSTGCYSGAGPIFGVGSDIHLYRNFDCDNACSANKSSFSAAVINSADKSIVKFSVDEYEVFQVINP